MSYLRGVSVLGGETPNGGYDTAERGTRTGWMSRAEGCESSRGVLLSSHVHFIIRHTVTTHTSFRNVHSYLSGE